MYVAGIVGLFVAMLGSWDVACIAEGDFEGDDVGIGGIVKVMLLIGHVVAVNGSQLCRMPRPKLENIKTPLQLPFPSPKLFKLSTSDVFPSIKTAVLCNAGDVAALLTKQESINERDPDRRPCIAPF